MTFRQLLLCLSLIICAPLLQSACTGGSGGGGAGGGGGGATPTPTPVPVVPGEDETVVIGEPGMCLPGDVARVDFDAGGKARFPLVLETDPCTPAKDNREEEYTLILYNTTAGAISYRLDAPVEAVPPVSTTALRAASSLDEPVAPKAPAPPTYKVGVNETDEQAGTMVRVANMEARLKEAPPLSNRYQRNALNAQNGIRALSVGEENEFRVRCSRTDIDAFCTTSAVLRAQGDHINIFVDRDAPFGGGNDDSLTTAQLDDVVTIFEENIYPLETSLLGSPSDVDGDGRVTILITPLVNNPLKADAYVDTRNLLPYDPLSNPGSNESEVIFVVAPDSLGNYKAGGNGLDAASYANGYLGAWIAFQLVKIISFNEHVLLREGTPEDDWIDDGVGALMADLAGFNIWQGAVYVSLAQPQLDDIRKAEDLDYVTYEGMEYLFMLYYLQSQVDDTYADADGDGFDDGMNVLKTLIQSETTGIANLEAAVDVTFDDAVETEFQSMFKDWTIAIATSGSGRTDLQQADQTAVKYYYELNPTIYGPNIATASGSTRTGADGGSLDSDVFPNPVGFDINNYGSSGFLLFENGDEHVWAPGSVMYGYVDPFSAMYVRLGGLFQARQTLSVLASASQLQGFLVRRTDVTFPHVYSESLFNSIDQHAEDLDTAGPNPYWATKLDYASLVATAPIGGASQDFLSIVGRIDSSDTIKTRGAGEEVVDSSVPDTDKYILQIPDLVGRVDEGELGIVLRRQFDSGSDEAALKPMLAIVSSKDVPYPYVPHPIRGATVATDTRQQYRWMAGALPCGDDDAGDLTSTGGTCSPTPADPTIAEPFHISYTGLMENTGSIAALPGWSGDITGGDCNSSPDLAVNQDARPLGVSTGGYGTSLSYPVTDVETSPSSLGAYPWSGTFMTYTYDGSLFPAILFEREFMKNGTGYPSKDPTSMYDPRSTNGLSLNCQLFLGATFADDLAPDSPDNFLAAGELSAPGTLVQQILTEMSRSRFDPAGNPETTVLAAQFNDPDVLAVDSDSRDTDVECTNVDVGNNLNSFTVRKGEGALLAGEKSPLEDHIAGNLNGSALGGDDQKLYYNPTNEVRVKLTPGKSYTIIVAGTGNTLGNYELRLRKISSAVASAVPAVVVDKENIVCSAGSF